ncbi:MAG: DNA polymerase IV, partial [Gammaproteobacteria bacterium]|nr:DNA polymerase IV [Gammaproteobacteria bacterium]
FFASVEQALHPELKGKPVIIGAERGIVAAASYEAKAKGIKRGVSLSEVTRICPQCILLPSDYESYSIFSKRMFGIMRQFTPQVEEYSIDEAFLDLTGTRRLHRTNYEEIGRKIQNQIRQELDITVSVGISLSKSTAKLCSKFRKPFGLTAVPGKHLHLLLVRTSLEKVWGFGPNTCALLKKHGLQTAWDFVSKPQDFAKRLLGKVGEELWAELRGEYVYQINPLNKTKQMSISKFKTFTPASAQKDVVLARALRNLEAACIKARRHHQVAKKVMLFLRKQDFTSSGLEISLFRASACPTEISKQVLKMFEELFQPGARYRATGVVLAGLQDDQPLQFNLLEDPQKVLQHKNVFAAVDEVAARFGKHKVFLANGVQIPKQHEGPRGKVSFRRLEKLPGETERQHVSLPLLH